MAVSHRAAVSLSLLTIACAARAADMCPAPPKYLQIHPLDLTPDDHLIHIDSDAGTLSESGAVVSGRVTVHQDQRLISADSVSYDRAADKVTVTGSVDFLDPQLRIRSAAGSYESVGNANFDQAAFDLMDRAGRGFAKSIDLKPDGKIDLSQVRYTSCPVGNEDWLLKASRIDFDTKAEIGVARNVTMRFKDVPIFYTPYISFPLGDERKSGVLFPGFGHSGNNGYEVDIPYYFNLAPNYDVTVTPAVLSARGVQLAESFRFLTSSSHGQIDGTVLPSDRKDAHDDRNYLRVADITDIQPGLRFDADAANISDVNYFSDFAVGSDQTSVTFLQRRADLLYYDDVWRLRAELQNFQTIDTSVPSFDRPASRVPAVQLTGLYPVLDSQFELGLDAEAVNFLREAGPCLSILSTGLQAGRDDPCASGGRINVSPEIRWSNRGTGYFFEPAAGFDFTQYALRDTTPGSPRSPSRALPYGRLDAGLLFERDAGSQNQRTQTLEPRVVYSYVPYRNQDELPIFDTGIPDLNLTELFRTNRFVGLDRIGDANQVALALTTRLFDKVSGAQYLSATIGQIRYFSIPRVTIDEAALLSQGVLPAGVRYIGSPGPVNPLSIPGALLVQGQSFAAYPGQYSNYLLPQSLRSTPGQSNFSYPASDLVTEIALTGYKHLSVNLNYQWNPYTSQTDKAEVGVQYRPDPTRVVNIDYRFQEGILKQYDTSFAWPIAQRWNTVGRWVYSLADHKTIEQVAGFEFRSCCYRVQLVQRRYLSVRPGSAINGAGLDTTIALQLELTGFSSVGKREDTFLERSIRGYSTRGVDAQ